MYFCANTQAVRLCTVAQAKRQLAVVLTLAIVYNAPKFAEGRLEQIQSVDRPSLTCAVHTPLGENDYYQIIYSNIAYCMFMFVIPLTILTVLNIRLMTALKDVNQKRREMQSARQQQDNNVTLVLIVVVIVFSVCQFPALVTQLSWTILSDSARLCGGFQFYFSRISNALVIANSAVNFLIYFRFNKRFRSILGQLVSGRKPSTGSLMVGGRTSCRRQPLTTMSAMATRSGQTGTTQAGGQRHQTSFGGLLAADPTGRQPPKTISGDVVTAASADAAGGGDWGKKAAGGTAAGGSMVCTSL